MKCYLCKTNLNRAISHLMKARNMREKTKYRDLCEPCFEKVMEREGYSKTDGIWRLEHIGRKITLNIVNTIYKKN